MNFNKTIHLLQQALTKELPGTDIQWEMASSDRMVRDFPRTKRKDSKLASVLILLYPVSGILHTVFIQRPEYEGVHGGQISFPGGKMEKTDKDLTVTAIREACEETGFCTDDLTIVGTLTPLYISVSNIEVTPVLAFCKSQPDFKPSSEEVVFLIEADLSHFLNTDNIREKPAKIRDHTLDIKYYDYKGNTIWGATAMILNELLHIIKQDSLL